MSKPSALPEWNLGGANSADPGGPKRTLGWTVGEAPASSSFNWWQKLVYDWASYIKDGQFSAGATGEGVIGNAAATTYFAGVKGTADHGPGVRGESNTGYGLVGVTTSNSAIYANAAGAYAVGIECHAGTDAPPYVDTTPISIRTGGFFTSEGCGIRVMANEAAAILGSANSSPINLNINSGLPAIQNPGDILFNTDKLMWLDAGPVWHTAIDNLLAQYHSGPAVLNFGATATTQTMGGSVEYVWPGYGFTTSVSDEMGILVGANHGAPGAPTTLNVHTLIVKTDGAQNDAIVFNVRVNGANLGLSVTLPAATSTATTSATETLFVVNSGDEISVSVTPGAAQTLVAHKVRVTVLASAISY